MSVTNANRRFNLLDRILWGVLGVFAAFVFVATVVMDGPQINVVGLIIAVMFGTLSGTGIFLGWGPLVPCMLLGIIVAAILTPTVASSAEEAVYQDLGAPLLGAICGTLLGFVIDSLDTKQRRHGIAFRILAALKKRKPPTAYQDRTAAP